MSAIYATYCHALTLLRREFWALVAVATIIELPAALLSEVHAGMPRRITAFFPVFLFGLLLYPIGEAGILSLLNRGKNETRWLEVAYRGVVSYTLPLVRVQLNEFALELVLFAPFFFIFRWMHFQNQPVLMLIMLLAMLISNSKLSPGEVAVVREKCAGKAAVKRAWGMTSGRRCWYVAGSLVGWLALSYISDRASSFFGDRNTEVVLVRGILEAAITTIVTVVTWCIYSHLLLREGPPGEIAVKVADSRAATD